MWHSYGSHAPLTSIRYLAKKWWRDDVPLCKLLKLLEISVTHPYITHIPYEHSMIPPLNPKARRRAPWRPQSLEGRRPGPRGADPGGWRTAACAPGDGTGRHQTAPDGTGWPGDGLGSFEVFWCVRDVFCWVLGLLGVLKWTFGWFSVSLLDLLCVFVSLMVWRFSGNWAAHIHWFYMIWLMISLGCWWVYPTYPYISIHCMWKYVGFRGGKVVHAWYLRRGFTFLGAARESLCNWRTKTKKTREYWGYPISNCGTREL